MITSAKIYVSPFRLQCGDPTELDAKGDRQQLHFLKHPTTFLLPSQHPRTSFLSLSFSPKLLVANLGVKVSGQADPITFSSFGTFRHIDSTPPTEGRSVRLRKPDKPSDDVPLPFHLLHHLKHRIYTKSPRMPPAIMPKTELCRKTPHISFCSLACRNTLTALCDMLLSGLVSDSVSFYLSLTDGSSQLASKSRSLTTSIPILPAVSTWNGPPTKSKSAVDLTVERKSCFQRAIMLGSSLGSCLGSTPYFKQTLLRRYNLVYFILGGPC